MTNLYVTANEKLIAALETPCAVGEMRVRLGLPIGLGRFSVVPDEDEMIHLAALPCFRSRNMRHCAIATKKKKKQERIQNIFYFLLSVDRFSAFSHIDFYFFCFKFVNFILSFYYFIKNFMIFCTKEIYFFLSLSCLPLLLSTFNSFDSESE